MPTLCQGGSRKIINELMLLLMLTLGLCGAHVGDGKGSFNCDGEDGGGDNEDWGDDDSGEDYDIKYRKTGASNHVGPVKVQPPFINPMIEILVAAKGSFLSFLLANSHT